MNKVNIFYEKSNYFHKCGNVDKLTLKMLIINIILILSLSLINILSTVIFSTYPHPVDMWKT